MRVLGIESSCDETAAAVVEEDGRVLADVVASQVETHAPYGGVVPELASRAHLKAVVPVVRAALAELPRGLDDVDAVAVTKGPGLIGALLVGIQVGKAIAFSRNLPLVGVNHLDGHLLAPDLHYAGAPHSPPPRPYVALLASGGHTALYLVDDDQEAELLGQTRDDAAGEAYDKVAKLLRLGYPGGPIIDRWARQGDRSAVPLPLPMLHRGLEFSFAGLKTAVAQLVSRAGGPEALSEMQVANVCASFQHAVVEVLANKAVAACEDRGARSLVLTGGVAANGALRARAAELAEARGVGLHLPPRSACTDNAAMIAYAGARELAKGARDGWHLTAHSRDPARRRGRFSRDGSPIPRVR